MKTKIPGIRLAYSLQGKEFGQREHSYQVAFGFFEKPHVTHPVLEEKLKPNDKLNWGNVHVSAFKRDKLIHIDFEPYPNYEYRDRFERNGLGAIIEYLVLKHFSNVVGRDYLIEHHAYEKPRIGHLDKTGRSTEKPLAIGEEIERLATHLRQNGLLKHIKRQRIPRDDTYWDEDKY